MRVLLAVVGVGILCTAFVFHERKSALEHRLGSVASQLADRHVRVHCQGVTGELLDTTAEAGTVRFGADGRPADVTDLKRPICDALRRFPHDVKNGSYACVLEQAGCSHAIFEDVMAVHTLAHESWHLRGNGSEAVTECHALQTTAYAATLLGADPQAAQATATYALLRLYPNMPDEYKESDCVNGGPMDLRPTDPHWP
jgi:hypothetical protein